MAFPTDDPLTPKQMRAFLKSDAAITREELDSAFAYVYPDVNPDVDELTVHQIATLTLIEGRRTALDEEDRKEREFHIDQARAYLGQNGFDPETLNEGDLYAVGLELAKEDWKADQAAKWDACLDEPIPDELEPTPVASLDEDTGAWVTEGGVIVGYRVEAGQTVEDILRLAGERITNVDAKLTGAKAEKQVWVDKIDAQHDPKINKLQRHAAWLRSTYQPLAERYIEDYNARAEAADDAHYASTGKVRKPTTKRSLKIDLLTIALRRTVPSMPVENHGAAIDALRKLYTDPESAFYIEDENERAEATAMIEGWIKKEEKLAVSLIPDEVKDALDVEGLAYVPGGDDECTLK